MKSLTACDAVKVTLTSTIGSAVLFSHVGFAQLLGSSSATLCILLAAGATTLIQSLCYAELATAVPGGGGDASYIEKAFSTNMALAYSLCSCCAILPASAAFCVSNVFDVVLCRGLLFRSLFVFSTLGLFYIPRRAWYGVLQLFFHMKIGCLALLAVLVASSVRDVENSFLATGWGRVPAGDSIVTSFVNCTYFFSGYNSCNYVASAPGLARPYATAVALITATYIYFTMGHMAVFSRVQLVGGDTLAMMFRGPLCAVSSSPETVEKASGIASAAIKCVMYLGPLFGCHTVFHGIISNAFSGRRRVYCLNGAYVLYGVAMLVLVETNGSLAILNNTSILMSCFYSLTLAALLRLRYKAGCRRSAVVPVSALLISAGFTCCNVYCRLARA